MAAAGGENLPWLEQVVTGIGWPGKSRVGEDGARAAWLPTQLADSDPAFQRRCLDLLIADVRSHREDCPGGVPSRSCGRRGAIREARRGPKNPSHPLASPGTVSTCSYCGEPRRCAARPAVPTMRAGFVNGMSYQ